jgi:hypothetical protein
MQSHQGSIFVAMPTWPPSTLKKPRALKVNPDDKIESRVLPKFISPTLSMFRAVYQRIFRILRFAICGTTLLAIVRFTVASVRIPVQSLANSIAYASIGPRRQLP